jgi:hypothetical protein
MDFGAIISRAIKVTWQHKVLWILGFLVALGGGGMGNVSSNPQITNRFSNGDMPWVQDMMQNPSIILAAISALLCVLAIVGIILWVVGLIAKGGLIAGVQQVETEGKTTFGGAWRVGVNRFWRMLGLNLLIFIPIVIVIVVLGVIMVLMFGGAIAASMSGGSRNNNDGAMGGLIAGGVAIFCCLFCVSVIVGIISAALQVFGERAIVLENLGVTESIGRAWRVFRANLGNIILLALVMLVISFIFGLIGGLAVGVILLPTLLPVITEGINSGVISTGATIVAVLGVLVASILGAIINTLFITFNSAAWTLAYRQFIATPVAPAIQPPAPIA